MAGRWTANSFQMNDNAAISTTQRTGGWTDGAGAGPAEGEDRRGRKDSRGKWPGRAGLGADRRIAPGVAEAVVTVPWVERRVWGH